MDTVSFSLELQQHSPAGISKDLETKEAAEVHAAVQQHDQIQHCDLYISTKTCVGNCLSQARFGESLRLPIRGCIRNADRPSLKFCCLVASVAPSKG